MLFGVFQVFPYTTRLRVKGIFRLYYFQNNKFPSISDRAGVIKTVTTSMSNEKHWEVSVDGPAMALRIDESKT